MSIKFSAALRAEFPFYPSKPRGDRIFPGQNFPPRYSRFASNTRLVIDTPPLVDDAFALSTTRGGTPIILQGPFPMAHRWTRRRTSTPLRSSWPTLSSKTLGRLLAISVISVIFLNIRNKSARFFQVFLKYEGFEAFLVSRFRVN